MARFVSFLLFLAALAAAAAELPVTEVVLYSSGVGYIQRSGSVTGDTVVTLSFKAEQINDLLKSLVLMDLDGGKVGAINYGAKDPVGKTLQAFAIDLTGNPSMAQLLTHLRGVQAEVTANTVITGKILGVEVKKKAIKDEVFEIEVLNLLTAAGIRSVRLEDISAIRLLDEHLNQELTNALDVLASSLDNQRRPVSITFTGKGTRRVKVGYVAEMPIWKTSYRLLFGEKDAFIQGWAIVENTSDADWRNVRLSLISGRPISFITDLYSPIYIPRPIYEPERFASLRPVTYLPTISNTDKDTPLQVGYNDRSSVNMRNNVQMRGGVVLDDTDGTALNQQANTVNGRAAGMLRPYQETVDAAAQAKDLGQGFQYTITDPVSLPRQQSAMLPIITEGIGAWKISISTGASKYPLYGMRLRNTTKLHLMGGPITVYDNDVYLGDAVIEDLQPGEERLVSYAVDLGMLVKRDEATTNDILSFKVVDGVMTMGRKHRRTVTYTAAVQDGKERKLVIEHAFQSGYKLIEPEKPEEKTSKLYRFIRTVDPKAPTVVKVVEEYLAYENVTITSQDTNMLLVYMQNGNMSDKVKQALQRAINLRRKMEEIRQQRTQAEAEITTITVEQNRIRSNMNALNSNSDLYKRYVSKLGEQETRIEKLRERIEDLVQAENAARKELNDYIAALNLD
jgi:hypothetical protein